MVLANHQSSGGREYAPNTGGYGVRVPGTPDDLALFAMWRGHAAVIITWSRGIQHSTSSISNSSTGRQNKGNLTDLLTVLRVPSGGKYQLRPGVLLRHKGVGAVKVPRQDIELTLASRTQQAAHTQPQPATAPTGACKKFGSECREVATAADSGASCGLYLPGWAGVGVGRSSVGPQSLVTRYQALACLARAHEPDAGPARSSAAMVV